jgi:DNA polymerase-3 subunit delta'
MDYKLKLEDSRSEVQAKILSALNQGTFPQSILIEGAAGIGKRKLAMQIGQLLACNSSVCSPCDSCFNCKQYNPEKQETPFVWICPSDEPGAKLKTKDKRLEAQNKVASSFMANPYSIDLIGPKHRIPVDFIRDLKASLSLKEKARKIVIIAYADKMNVAAANALLKTLEDVPSNIYFILTTSARSSLLPTILSRCLRFTLSPHLYKEVSEIFNSPNIHSLFQVADGSIGKIQWLQNGSYQVSLDKALEFLQIRSSKKMGALLEFIEDEKQLLDASKATEFLEALYILLGDLQLLQFKQTIRCLDFYEVLQGLELPTQSPEKWQNWLNIVSEAKLRLKQNCRAKSVLGAMALQLL